MGVSDSNEERESHLRVLADQLLFTVEKNLETARASRWMIVQAFCGSRPWLADHYSSTNIPATSSACPARNADARASTESAVAGFSRGDCRVQPHGSVP